MAKVELKKPVIEEIRSVMEGAKSGVLVDHRGLTVAQDTQLRRELREAGVTYKVYKNTMMSFAFMGSDFGDLIQQGIQLLIGLVQILLQLIIQALIIPCFRPGLFFLSLLLGDLILQIGNRRIA